MLDSHHSVDRQTFRGPLAFIFLISSCFSLILIYKTGSDVLALDLNANDGYMRYIQFKSWLESGHWYLEPMPNFNPQDGLIIHWSRFPDIPLALVSIVASFVVDLQTSYALAMIIVPSLYLLGIVAAIGFFTYRLIGKQYVVIACFYLLSSHVITKFFPGVIDHHNLQLLCAAWFLALSPLKKSDCKNKEWAVLQGSLLALSFWVGLENLIFFALLSLSMTLMGYLSSKRFLYYCRLLCLSALFFGLIACLLNRPITEIGQAQVDAISWPYLFCLTIGALFCQLSIQTRWVTHKPSKFILSGIICLSLILLVTPDIILGVYHNYPELLNRYWLSHVSEANSIFSYIELQGFFSKHNYVLFMLPALGSVFFIRKRPSLLVLYILLIFSLLPALFWQVRTVYLAYLISTPLQAFFVISLNRKLASPLTQTVVALLSMPISLALLVSFAHSTLAAPSNEKAKLPLERLKMVSLLEQHQINQVKIVAPIDYGAAILALTDNAVISAPYHRNIKGNELAARIFTSMDSNDAKVLVKQNKIDLLMYGNDPSSNVYKKLSSSSSFINQLDQKKMPDWLELIAENEQGIKLLKVRL